jgi:hypothetical protein
MSRETAAEIQGELSKARLRQLARDLNVTLVPDAQKAGLVAGIIQAAAALDALLPKLTRDELRAACRAQRARVIKPEDKGLGTIANLDPPRHFAAYLHALKWSSV